MSKDVVAITKEETVVRAAELMVTRETGSVIVTDGVKVVGVLTEKDVLTKVLAAKKKPEVTLVVEAMSSPPITVNTEMSVYSASKMMEENGIRRLPVVSDGKLVGVVTQTDLSNVMRSVIIDVVPQVEAELKSTPLKMELREGRTYMVQEKKPLRSYEIFADMVKHGFYGLCIARMNPKRVREYYELATTPIIWVTDIKSEEKSVDPKDLKAVSNMIGDFLKKADKGVVFMEAVPYLIDRNSFDEVLAMIQHLRDIVSESTTCLILYVDPIILTEKELVRLMKEVDEVRFRAY